MNVLYDAIHAKYAADTNLVAVLTNGLFFKEATQKTDYPYGVFFPVSDVPNWTFTEDAENYVIQFNIFSDNSSSDEVDNMFEKLKSCFDWCALTVTGYNHIYMKRELTTLLYVEDVWQYSVSYRVEIQAQ